MFKPKYEITPLLIDNIKKITATITKLNQKIFPRPVLAEFERRAREISAHTSTSIEGNLLPLTEVKKILKNQPKHLRDSEKEVVNYNNTLLWLNQQMKEGSIQITSKVIKEVQGRLIKGLLPQNQVGQFRQEGVQISDPRGRGVLYLPPDYQVVPKLIDELLAFVNKEKTKLDPTILAGLFHKQLVIIHPFLDGNGRTARLLTRILLAELGIDTFHLFSFENYYNRDVSRYFLKVGVFGDYYELKDWIDYTAWLEYFTGGIVDELLRVGSELAKRTISPKDKLPAHLQKIMISIEKNGYINDASYAKLTSRAKATRSLDFNRLIKLGLIQRLGKGKNTYYQF